MYALLDRNRHCRFDEDFLSLPPVRYVWLVVFSNSIQLNGAHRSGKHTHQERSTNYNRISFLFSFTHTHNHRDRQRSMSVLCALLTKCIYGRRLFVIKLLCDFVERKCLVNKARVPITLDANLNDDCMCKHTANANNNNSKNPKKYEESV